MRIQWWIAACFSMLQIIQLKGGDNVADRTEYLSDRTVTQVGIIVRDIEKTSRAWAELLGVETPRWFLTDPAETAHTTYMGKPTTARAKLVFFDLGQVQLELIEPVGGPSTWKDFLDQKGEGVHHIAFAVRDMDGRIRALEGLGTAAVQRGDYTGGRYGYIASDAKLGVALELLENFSGTP
jgi:methylmalonyl-CoA/ethylmalonyl-CoA epimerase